MQNTETHWHLNKSVPIALILAVFVQTIGVVWWAASTDTRLLMINETLHEQIVDNDKVNLRQWEKINSNQTNIQGVLTLGRTTQAILERVERSLNQTQADVSKQNELMRQFLSDN